MAAEFELLPEDEQLKAENDFLKMKMMLENSAHFGGMQDDKNSLDPAIENIFLKNVIAFEKNFASERNAVKLFDKIGQPTQFLPACDIADNDFEAAWKRLDEYLQLHNICLSACSPKVTAKEMYRFTVEELFEHEMDDFAMDGFICHFTYDEFYPDIEYENTNVAVDDCIKAILSKDLIEWMPSFVKENLLLNNFPMLREEEFKEKVNFFKQAYHGMDDVEVEATSFLREENCCTVNGSYSCIALVAKDALQLSGNWKVAFELEADTDYWYINSVEMTGIQF